MDRSSYTTYSVSLGVRPTAIVCNRGPLLLRTGQTRQGVPLRRVTLRILSPKATPLARACRRGHLQRGLRVRPTPLNNLDPRVLVANSPGSFYSLLSLSLNQWVSSSLLRSSHL